MVVGKLSMARKLARAAIPYKCGVIRTVVRVILFSTLSYTMTTWSSSIPRRCHG
jgi:hypothetical protein